ncbi:PAS domain-containing protein [Oceanibaculum pacificum]|uniref:PAS domain-containing protein n=1 Tax=Oceanibaculum pacificum TaxID=580166 RepID=A0A154WGQ1_9PROT|nr:PAS domain-containing protein [Oceanibaculum pacificum]KZD12666.1 hypothetical protein AUP43_15675 [Oceanibaculum pacificum]
MPPFADPDLSHVVEPRLQRFADYWRDKRRDLPIPRRADIDPVDFPWLLPNVWLVHYEAACDRFRYRLAGEQIKEVHPGIVAGQYMDEFMSPAVFEAVNQHYRQIMGQTTASPLIMHMRGFIYQRHNIGLTAVGERLILPLLDGDDRPTIIFGATIYSYDHKVAATLDSDQTVTLTPIDYPPLQPVSATPAK